MGCSNSNAREKKSKEEKKDYNKIINKPDSSKNELLIEFKESNVEINRINLPKNKKNENDLNKETQIEKKLSKNGEKILIEKENKNDKNGENYNNIKELKIEKINKNLDFEKEKNKIKISDEIINIKKKEKKIEDKIIKEEIDKKEENYLEIDKKIEFSENINLYEKGKFKNESEIKSTNEKENIFNNIKSKFIIKIIFKNIKKEKYYNIIRYNQKIQNRLNIGLIDYKKLSQKNNCIEIFFSKETVINKDTFKFIWNSNCYHFYNDDEELDFNSKNNITVSRINLSIDFEVKSLIGLFKDKKFISKINLSKFKIKDIYL